MNGKQPSASGLGDFPHYMLKEIFEQPKALRDTIASRLSSDGSSPYLEEAGLSAAEIRSLRRIHIAASGTSRHAGMAGQYMIQELARLPVDVSYASEFDSSAAFIGPEDLTIVITQSGETADTSAAQRIAKARGCRTLAISNVVDSTIAREALGALYTQAGPEISIASTKAFTAQMAVLFLLAMHLGQMRGTLTPDDRRRYSQALLEIPEKAQAVLRAASTCERLADEYHHFEDFLFLGRAIHYPIAMDGALKLKEISYVHAEGYPTGETKHGPNALIDERLPVVMLATCDRSNADAVARHEKDLANLRSFQRQSGKVIAIGREGDEQLADLADRTILIPPAPEMLLPILEIIPLQLFAYYIAVRKGLNVDRPRNLVKAVTAE